MSYRTRHCNKIAAINVKHDFFKNIKSSPNSTFNCHNPKGVKLLSRLRLGLSHLREHKFKHSFQDSLNPFCSCGKVEVETSSHYLLYCSNYSEERLALLNAIKNIGISILQQSDSKFTSVLLFGDTSFDNNKNTIIFHLRLFVFIFSTRLFFTTYMLLLFLPFFVCNCFSQAYE